MNFSYSQDSTDVDVLELVETSKIRWVNQIPPLEEDVRKKKKGWFKRLLLGENKINSFQKPVSLIAIDPDHCMVLDQGNGTLFYAEEGKITTPKVIRKEEINFPSLVAVCLLPSNELLFTDSKSNTIYSLSENHKELKELIVEPKLIQPTGIAYSRVKDQIWVVETGAHRLVVLDLNGNIIKTIGQRGMGNGEFNYPTHIWIDQKGLVYVVDSLNYRIQIFDESGNFISMFGENGDGTGYLARPKGIAVDSNGNIYVVDVLFNGVQIFDFEGNYLYQFGSQGSRTEEFWMPSGIFIDKNDFIYIADSYNSRIQIFELTY
jgi:DNA-binding beta-propeller fold protein YncE